VTSDKDNYSQKELKLTAAIYASRPGVVEHVRKTGKLPKEINTGGGEIQTRVLIEQRGNDITLTSEEQLVFDAIINEKRLPGGSVRLIDKE
jgi:hypothetical protein